MTSDINIRYEVKTTVMQQPYTRYWPSRSPRHEMPLFLFSQKHIVQCLKLQSFEGTCGHDPRIRWFWMSHCFKFFHATNHFWAQTNSIKLAQRKQSDPGSEFFNPIKGVCPVLSHTRKRAIKSSTLFVLSTRYMSTSGFAKAVTVEWDLNLSKNTGQGQKGQ